MKITKITNSYLETIEFGKEIAQKFLENKNNKHAQILAFEGDLGAGKTTFIQGFAQGLGIKEPVLSPTFVIFRKFKIKDPSFNLFYHIDCYRLRNSQDLLDLGFKEFSSNPKNIIAIEWSDIVNDILPDDRILVHIDSEEINKRIIKIQ